VRTLKKRGMGMESERGPKKEERGKQGTNPNAHLLALYDKSREHAGDVGREPYQQQQRLDRQRGSGMELRGRTERRAETGNNIRASREQ
jgi:hypothetical protein